MENEIMDNVAKLDEIFPNRQPFHNIVQVIHPEMARYAEMHLTSSITQIPWEEIYNIIKNNETSDSNNNIYKQVQEAIYKFNQIKSKI